MNLRKAFDHPRYLQRVLLVDAIATGATAVKLALAADWLEPLLALPAPLLRGAGLSLVPFVLFVAMLSSRHAVPRGAMAAVVAINVAWVVASAWLVVAGPYQPNTWGVAFVLLQAAVVAVFAELGWIGLRRPTRAAAHA